jgi:hypothetical protein
MKALLERRSGPVVLTVIAGALVALVQASPLAAEGGSLLLALLFWTAVAQGSIAAAAAGTLVNARWLASVKRELLSVIPVLYLLPVLFLLLLPFMDMYPWTGRKGIWFHPNFFIGRNAGLLLLAALAAGRFAAASLRDDGRTKVPAATYLFAYVASQSLVAFDWVMSLDHPWFSTLFGGYFFIEALFAGFAVSAILYTTLHGRSRGVPDAPHGRSDLKDLATLLFGFSLMWAGLFYSQFLVIWYGNIPEEVSFVAARVEAPPLRQLSLSVLALFFFIPFLVLLSGRAKANSSVVFAISLSILTGILVERYVFLAPLVRLEPGALVIQFLSLFLLFVALAASGARGRTRRGA